MIRGSIVQLRVFLALAAWFAQLCLPAAHAAAMATAMPGALAWCGPGISAGPLQAKVAQLPAEIRQVLQDLPAQSADPLETCRQLCAASGAGGAVPTQAGPVAAFVAGRGSILPPAAIAPAVRSHGALPPPRGPPALRA